MNDFAQTSFNPWMTFISENHTEPGSEVLAFVTDLNRDGHQEYWFSTQEWGETSGRLGRMWEVYLPTKSGEYSRHAPLLDNPALLREDSLTLQNAGPRQVLTSVTPANVDNVGVSIYRVDAPGVLHEELKTLSTESAEYRAMVQMDAAKPGNGPKIETLTPEAVRKIANDYQTTLRQHQDQSVTPRASQRHIAASPAGASATQGIASPLANVSLPLDGLAGDGWLLAICFLAAVALTWLLSKRQGGRIK